MKYKQCEKCNKLCQEKDLHEVVLKENSLVAAFAVKQQEPKPKFWCTPCIESKNKK